MRHKGPTLALLLTVLGCARGCRDDAPPPPTAAEPLGPTPRDASSDRPLRRLSNAELSAALASLFALGPLPEAEDERALLAPGTLLTERFEYPPDPTEHNFDNVAERLAVTPEFLERHLAAVAALTEETLAVPERARALVRCDAPASDACLRRFVRVFAEHAWRRPISPDEDARLYARASAEARAGHAWLRRLAAEVLMAPQFLYVMGSGEDVGGAQRLTGYDLAARLAFALWGDAPDRALLAAARGGALDTADGVEATARAMLSDPRAATGARRFYERWLRLDHLRASSLKTHQLHPELERRRHLRGRYLASLHRTLAEAFSPRGGDLLALLDTRSFWVDDEVAYVMGLHGDPPDGDDEGWSLPTLRREAFPATTDRAGILAHPALLALGATASGQVSPVRRGNYVREVLLCDEVGAPPPGVVPVPLSEHDLEIPRAALAEHRAQAPCAGCHARLEPLGFGLERFDNVGMRFPPDAPGAASRTGEGELALGGATARFVGAAGLAARLRDEPAVRRCLVTHYARWALGRVLRDDDRPHLDAIDRVFVAGGRRFEALALAVARSELFRSAPREAAP